MAFVKENNTKNTTIESRMYLISNIERNIDKENRKILFIEEFDLC